ncbi:hypothetical protein CSUI_004784, partial [Cystoisospora suis]
SRSVFLDLVAGHENRAGHIFRIARSVTGS